MSVSQSRLCLLVGRYGSLFSRQTNVLAPTTVEGRRNLTMNPKYKKPYPYENKSFGVLRAAIDFTSSRLNENSRILLVEGPPCVGKSEFAQNLAKTFKLKYIPPVKNDDLFIHNGFDIRELNDMMPREQMKSFDLDVFYTEQDPQNLLKFGALQMMFFQHRFHQYVAALKHVLHTGQGVVLENSIYGDACYALNMAEQGYFTKKGIKWFMEFQQNALSVLWKPHLVIHLDAPSSLVVQRMKEQNPKYADSPVVTESYFDGLRDKIANAYIPFISEHCDTLYYDVTQMEDFDLVAMDLESMDLIEKRFAEGMKFMDWRSDKEEYWSMYRVLVSDQTKMNLALQYRLPIHCPELLINGEELQMMLSILDNVAQLQYSEKQWHDKDGNLVSRPDLMKESPLSYVKDTQMYRSLHG